MAAEVDPEENQGHAWAVAEAKQAQTEGCDALGEREASVACAGVSKRGGQQQQKRYAIRGLKQRSEGPYLL